MVNYANNFPRIYISSKQMPDEYAQISYVRYPFDKNPDVRQDSSMRILLTDQENWCLLYTNDEKRKVLQTW